MYTKAIPVKDLKFTNLSLMAKEITTNVNNYFKNKGPTINGKKTDLSKKGNWQLFFKAIFFFFGFWVIYYFMIFYGLPTWVMTVLCILSVFFAAGIGFSVMHDGNHGSFSKHSWINSLTGRSSSTLGASSLLWKTKHNIIHHRGTNIDHVDDDIEASPLLRLHDAQPWYLVHKYQHIYWPFAYGLLFLFWIVKDFKKYFTGKIMGEKVSFSFWDHVLFWAGKVFFGFMFIYIPINQLGFKQWLLGFLLFAGLLGFVLSWVFQLAHIVRGLKHPVFEEVNGTESMEHQISTTADFAPNNKLIRWWTGGLNFQIEHHLFPRISHVHYPAIHQIVKQVCGKYNFPMLVIPTVGMATISHAGKLKDFGKRP